VLLPILALASVAKGVQLDPESEDSLRAATRQYAYGLMSLYKNNATSTAPQDVGIWPQPYYWWEGGAAWYEPKYNMFAVSQRRRRAIDGTREHTPLGQS
jgi:mannan endo-1,6-alpha-mannosidase